jgi:hypothetical protein
MPTARSSNSLAAASYRAVVEFTAPSGATIRFTSPIGVNPPPAPVGGHVRVRYTPDNPQDTPIDQYWQTWFLPTLLGMIGTPLLLIGLGFGAAASAHRRRSRAQPAHRSIVGRLRPAPVALR